jgi:integral membrane protein (TIGR01906 family)
LLKAPKYKLKIELGDMQMKKLGLPFTALFIVLIPVVLLLTNVQLIAFNRDYYMDEYIKYNIPEHIGMSMDNLMASTEQLLLYLEDKREDLNFQASFIQGTAEFFSDRDKMHMVDVKMLFVKGRWIRDAALLYIIGYAVLLFRRKPLKDQLKRFARYGIYAVVMGVVPVLILIVLMYVDFYKYFTIFHEIFFTNDLWLLDPGKDMLVNILPEAFFTDMAFSISYLYIAEMVFLLVGSLLLLRRVKKT